MLIWCVFIPLVVGVLPHKRLDHYHEHATNARLMELMNVKEEIGKAVRNTEREAGTQQLLQEGHFDGIRLLVSDSWLDDDTHTCQPQTPANKRRKVSNNKDPLLYYATQPVPTITIFNRDQTSLQHEVKCTAANILTISHKAYIRKYLVPRLLSQLSTTFAPRFKGSGGSAPLTGNDDASLAACKGFKCVKCRNSHFVFPLPFPYTFPNHDVLLFISAEPDITASTAFPCMFASDGRPSAIVLNIAPNKLAAMSTVPLGQQKFYARVLQSMLHAMGFDPSMFDSWKQGQSPSFTIPAPNNSTVDMLGTPNVKKWIMTTHFRCTGHPKGGSGTIDGAELEDALKTSMTILPYWESRLYKGEILTMLPDIASDYGTEIPVVSGLTLAAFEDMGWYAVNKKTAQPLKWLAEQPCNTASIDCTRWPSRYTCTRAETRPLCSPDFTSVGVCAGFEWPSLTIPDKFRRDVLHINWGGMSALMDFCPYRSGEGIVGASCLVAKPDAPDCQNEKCATFQVRGENSRCFESNLRYAEYGQAPTTIGTCIPHKCVKVGSPVPGQPQTWKVSLFIGGQTYTCDGSATEVGPSNGTTVCGGSRLTGTVKCPNTRELCEEAGEQIVKTACDPMNDCNGRGTCSATGECVCYSELKSDGRPLHGMFAGSRCQYCHQDYYGPECKQQKCPIDPVSKAMCYNNGVCSGGACVCNANSTHGYFSNATNCRTCMTGYTGGSCKLKECDAATGTGCAKGVCNAATLRCTCYNSNAQGYWTNGELGVCDRCKPGYDLYQSCKVRITNYHGCDTVSLPDVMSINICQVQCAPGESLPWRVPATDSRGCTFNKPSPECKNSQCPTQKSALGNSSSCPTPSFTPYDCKGYPNLYHDCWMLNECGCNSPQRPSCIPGTDAAPSPDAYSPVANLRFQNNAQDVRTQAAATGTEVCRCPAPGYRPSINCWSGWVHSDPAYPGGVQPKKPYKHGYVVVFEPQQLFEEDFCHCTSPPIPRCSSETKPEWLLTMTQGKRLDCNEILADFGCPNWDHILNVGGRRNSSDPDMSLIDCDGWPPPKLVTDTDPCGCPFPQFKCLPGTKGACDNPPNCPKWDPLPPINCLGQMPPVLTLHGAHPCGCPPPPTPTCIPGTERQTCNCKPEGTQKLDGVPCSHDDVEWVNCMGTPLEAVQWSPYVYYAAGDPYINTCDPCPQCPRTLPTRRCLPGTGAPVPKLDNKIPRVCLDATFNKTQCIQWPAPCPVDCKGKPKPAEKDYDASCECPPEVPVPPCLPGTDGSPPEADIRSTPCDASPHLCKEYSCGGGNQDVEAIAYNLALSGDYSARARDQVLEAIGGTKYCVQEGQCSSHYNCAAGYYCGVCGLCLFGADTESRGCLADRGASCGNYRCEVECDPEGIAKVRNGLRDASCNTKCLVDTDCRLGAVCSKGTYSAPPDAGSAFAGKVRIVGRAREDKKVTLPKGIPGYNLQATPPFTRLTDEPYEFVPLREYGECIVPEQPDPEAVQYCFSHNECNGYACGTTNKQYMFSNSRCMVTCWVNAHCHPDFRCIRLTGTCVTAVPVSVTQEGGETLPDGPTCDLQDSTFCSPYWCGGHRGKAIQKGASCPKYCMTDNACQPFYECVFPDLEDLQEEFHTSEQEASCNAETGTAIPAASKVNSRLMSSNPRADTVTKGTCKPFYSLKRRAQSPEDLIEQRETNPFTKLPSLFKLSPLVKVLPMLVVPLGDTGGYQEDPNTVRFLHAPFMPPEPLTPPPIGTLIQRSVAECHPYVGVANGITESQIEQMKLTALSARMDPNTGTFMTLPACKSFCADDSDCAGGYFCTKPSPIPVYVSRGGRKIVAGGSGRVSYDLGLQNADEDFSAPENKPREPRVSWKGKCQVKRGLGTVCKDNGECGSGHCWDGLCCNTACEGACQTCERMGICGWVVPHTSPGNKCGKCFWCEYVSDTNGKVTAAAPLECAPAPEGHDPSDSCGPHATCNGEGACVADEGWGGEGDTCASGRSGPNCDTENLHFRTVVTEETYHLCTQAEAARLSSSPSLSHFASVARTSVSNREGKGFATQLSPPRTYKLRQNVIDRRARQWAIKVLGVSSHSKYGCSNILHEPSVPRWKRVHAPSPDAWAPGQYVKSPPGVPDEVPQKKYSPWVDCIPLETQGSCTSKSGCKWNVSPSPGFCSADMTTAEANTKPSTVTLTGDGINYNVKSIPAKQPYEWIELEFETPIVIEAVVIHENYYPGSIVKIESQPALTGSAALAAAGGGAPATDPVTGQEIKLTTVTPPKKTGSTAPAASCGALTSQGMTACVSDLGCYWISNECKVTQATCSKIGKESCMLRELSELCWWDGPKEECRDGRRPGCYAVAGYDHNKHQLSCSVYNDKVAYPADTTNPDILCNEGSPQKCNWVAYTADYCVENAKSCALLNGKPSLCVSPCMYDSGSAVCSDGPFPSSMTRAQYCSRFTNGQQCGAAVHCDWIPNKSLTGCRAVTISQCTFNLDSATCTRLAACEYVSPPVLTPAPTTFTTGCPDLPSYPNSISARYGSDNGTVVVLLTCAEGYTQDTSAQAICIKSGTPRLEGTPLCVPYNCSAYNPPTNAVVDGYTTAPPFSERQQGSTPILLCSTGNVTGTMPVCFNGLWTGGSASCSTAVRRTSRTLQNARDDNPHWWVPDHDFDDLSDSLLALHERWARGLQHLEETHKHHHVMKVLQSGDSLLKVCSKNPLFVADPAVQGGSLDWTALCMMQKTEGTCLYNDEGATPGSTGDRAGKCVWETLPLTGDTEITNEPVTGAEAGTYGDASPPLPFTFKDMGPTLPSDRPMLRKDETKPTPTNIRCEDLPQGASLNANKNNYTTIWERPYPNFVEPKRYRELTLDMGHTGYKSKNIRITFAPTANGRSMIDAVAVVGFEERTEGLKCKGEIWSSPVRDGTRLTAGIQTATVQPVPCNGRGRCSPRGCECFGNFYGEGCETCKFGWTGPGCNEPIKVGCTEIAFEDLSQYDSEEEVRSRWKYDNYKRFTSTALRWKHFGSKLTSPQYNLGHHTHIKLDIGTLMVDVPLSDDCGLVIAVASAAGADDKEIIYSAGCEYFSGLNIIGEERGDKLGFFSVQRRWAPSTAVISVEVWWGKANTGSFVFTILNFAFQTCTWPDVNA